MYRLILFYNFATHQKISNQSIILYQFNNRFISHTTIQINMGKMISTESYQGFLYQFIKSILLSITLVISSTNFHTCVSNITSLESGMLHMSVSSSIDKQIQVRFSLSEAAKGVNLADYSLRISLSPAEAVNKGSVFQYYTGSAVYQEVHIQRQLLDFPRANGGVLAKNQELTIPFQLVPGIGVKQIKVKFELLDSTGRVVSKSKLGIVKLA